MIDLLVFCFGAIIGSFLNVVTLRLGTGESVVSGGSKCFSCGKKLKWTELVPIFSFLIQKGRCRKCKSKISLQYPAVEILTGLIFFLIFNFQFSIINEFSIINFAKIFYLLAIAAFLILIAVYDYRHQIIPNLFVWLFNGLAFLNLFENWSLKIENFNVNGLLAGLILFIFFASLWFFSGGRWMGFGDAKLALGIGWLLGIANGIAAITLAFWIGAFVGILLLYLSKNKYGLKSNIAFGPFMVLGTIISLFWGEKIISFLF
ncbi:MAG: hypothetical protein COV02_00905 [Candidatus Terrybacteria bacterium CG10_big_fil_rev_8_21_14_0_10_41_10]|uniref:Prepilin peptidase n=1 Tax=Candidatus Terrybacteria bacterium CG10_big_fil_rev_8_21_14_0_10_41_10 TaxID=1975026 RepID=A0A2M8LAX5_9BACT|nr:MAG: hypothetical protein COV02_00905 [Candidatus Terrybacteria bacterium CG10_big_fil_rev_8_21_14_0_10_41_10]